MCDFVDDPVLLCNGEVVVRQTRGQSAPWIWMTCWNTCVAGDGIPGVYGIRYNRIRIFPSGTGSLRTCDRYPAHRMHPYSMLCVSVVAYTSLPLAPRCSYLPSGTLEGR